jgi:hypothetical protein
MVRIDDNVMIVCHPQVVVATGLSTAAYAAAR